MLINQIVLRNFRVYNGNNDLSFSTDQYKNITVIAGNNGYGKTSFLTALVWGLYGKLMVDVDDRYRQDIKESGGYKKYCEKLMNRNALNGALNRSEIFTNQLAGKNISQRETIQLKAEHETSFSVSLKFSEIMIPSVVCNQVEIKRTYNINNDKEKVEILIDGRINELTRNVGPEIFINDFILPKEIAKFFFFDAEKIVSLAEINSIEEKKYLSQSYSEVLGIKKYTDLKNSLEQMRYRIREKSAIKSDRNNLTRLNKSLDQSQKLILHKNDRLSELAENIQLKKFSSDKYQEQLIREGSALTLEELRRLKDQKNILTADLIKTKARFNDLLELAPFAMLANRMDLIRQQLQAENVNSATALALLSGKLNVLTDLIQDKSRLIGLDDFKKKELIDLIKDTLLPNQATDVKMLLNFTPEQQNKFFIVYENLKNSYSKTFKALITDQKRLQSVFNDVNRKLLDAESKSKDPVIADIRKSKEKLDEEIHQLEQEKGLMQSQKSHLESEIQTFLRQISELSKKVELEDVDREKDMTAERLIEKLDIFIQKLKQKKKGSLENNILRELNSLMHKSDFVSKVNVIIRGDLIDIELYDNQNVFIDKELLSKGEQQLYATALLKALVDESNIRFPVFIDSPLQKFDKNHSENIIKEFYPNLSTQVVLFPLLQKELNEEEYKWMENRVGKTYLIEQSDQYNSGFFEVKSNQLFDSYKQSQQHV